MIKLYDATLANALPEVLSEQPWGRGFAAAVQRQQRQLLNLARRISLYAAVDDMPEAVLDVMAADLRVPRYLVSYPLATKRTLIRGALTYWSQAGTKAAVESRCGDIFGDATVSEWYEYGGKAGYFKVTTTNSAVTEQNVAEFRAAVEAVKRLSAWLEGVELVLSTPDFVAAVGFTVQICDSLHLKM